MTPQQYPDFAKMLVSLAEVYNKKTPSEFVLSIWWQALKVYELSSVRQALSAHVANPDNGQFMPKPADVVRFLGGTTKDKALIAWSKVTEAVGRVGTWESVVFDDPIIHAVLNCMGGWTSLGQKNDDEWPFVQNEFVTRYRSYSATGAVPSQYPPRLIGQYEANNRLNGQEVAPPKLIGDPELAQMVMSGGVESHLKISSPLKLVS